MSTCKSIRIGDREIELYPLKNHFENLLKLGYAAETAQYVGSEKCMVIETDQADLDYLIDMQSEITCSIANSVEAISNVIAMLHGEMSEQIVKDLAWIINYLTTLQRVLFDAAAKLEDSAGYVKRISNKRN